VGKVFISSVWACFRTTRQRSPSTRSSASWRRVGGSSITAAQAGSCGTQSRWVYFCSAASPLSRYFSLSIKPLGEGVVVRLLEGGVPSAALVAMTAVGTEPDDRASGPVAVVIDATGKAAAVMACRSIASVTRRVALRRSPRWR